MKKEDDIARGVEKGIKAEKVKESVGVFMVIGTVALSLIVGNMFNPLAGFVLLFSGLIGTWIYYKS